MKLSVGIITYNEESRIGKTLDSVKEIADEIIVVDSESSDRTVEIAKAKGAEVFIEKWKGYGPQKNSVLEKCSGDWILLIDADEVVSLELKKRIKEIINGSSETDVYKIKLRNIILVRFYKHFEIMNLKNRRKYGKTKKGYFGLQSKIWKCQYNFKQF